MPDRKPGGALMGRCKDCRHWEAIQGEPGDGLCFRLSIIERDHADLPFFRILSASRRSANVITGELFGCNNFEAKTDARP